MSLQTKRKHAHRHRKTHGYQGERGERKEGRGVTGRADTDCGAQGGWAVRTLQRKEPYSASCKILWWKITRKNTCDYHFTAFLKLTQSCEPPTLQFKTLNFTSCYGCWEAGKWPQMTWVRRGDSAKRWIIRPGTPPHSIWWQQVLRGRTILASR